MKPAVKRYRRIEDGLVVEAIQYTFSGEPISNIAKFVLNMDVDVHLAVENERILDVVRPVLSRWNPQAGVGTIEIIDPGSGQPLRVEVNDWIARHGKKLLVMKPGAFMSHYEELPPEIPRTELDELADVIYNSFKTLEGELYQALAENAAAAVIRAGWARKGRTS